ncbi:uncharacterized protein BDR25DRAFT_307706 [Lindgomyces ingoldianus]|uniref:Uncharacterized protein n=1 Tax=Lindgomyces ingoldianus TaxID=673940 RepID=A0ACB6Q976_9PLEO|nr:uncharacterized protein BDR25DRAFT_307706 [Lindgomyces ingoldianus]KAF2463518.1 hypothetical protein BDR25DRAFT_307706 [Lindgomyces ingoldianus]
MKLNLALFLAVAAAAAESVIDYTKLPNCAKQCTVLQQAEAGCIPPAAPVTNQATYQSCLCHSTLLTAFYSSGAQCVTTGCSPDDSTKISQYYTSLCAGPVVQPPGGTTTAATATATTASGTTSSASKTATGVAAGAQGVSNANSSNNDWFHTHWRWVVMVIVIFLAIVFFWVGGIFLRRHFTRKHEAARANMAAKDAPYVAPHTPSSNKSTLGKGATPQDVNFSPMTMSGGRNGMAMDGGVGGIAPPRGPPRTRSRTNTLQSLVIGNGSKTHLPQPVVWGPHQHQAFAKENGTNSPGSSVPPSPTVAISPPHPVFRNREAINSEPRLAGYRPNPNGASREPMAAYGYELQGRPGQANWNPGLAGEEIVRPHTAGGGAARHASVGHALSGMRSDPILNPSAEPQTAEICQVTPNKLHKRPE